MSDSFILGAGFIIDLDELAALLDYASHDEHRWEAVTDDTGQWGEGRCVIILYSNPSGTDMPNEISFRFWCLSYDYPFFPIWLVCLHPSLAEPVRGGLARSRSGRGRTDLLLPRFLREVGCCFMIRGRAGPVCQRAGGLPIVPCRR